MEETVREMLFRGKDDNTEEWVYGSYLAAAAEHIKDSSNRMNDYICHYNAETDKSIKYIITAVNRNTVGQYIGSTDKNKNKIFEHDIVYIESEDEYFVVEWDSDSARFVMNNESLTLDFDNYWSYQVEIVGNIFDNPELSPFN